MNEERVALISGASRGIGAAMAARLSAAGWRLSLGMRDPALPPGCDTTRSHLAKHDAMDADEARWVAEAMEAFGRIDAVICNAGVMKPGAVTTLADADLDLMWEVNAKSPRRLVAAAWPHLRASGRGRVIVVASMSGRRVKSALSTGYSMTKHAAMALMYGVRHEGWADGIRATAICPGFVATDMARAITDHPDAEMTQPEEIARLTELALDLPNTASMAELNVNCLLEDRA